MLAQEMLSRCTVPAHYVRIFRCDGVDPGRMLHCHGGILELYFLGHDAAGSLHVPLNPTIDSPRVQALLNTLLTQGLEV